jgi:AmmeMemoRadiSam system protein B
MQVVRQPAVAGMFYPADKSELESLLSKFFSEVNLTEKYERVRGLIAPHAGYAYSGLTAAYAYSTLEGKSYDTVVVISPSHREYFLGSSVFEGEAYSTPLGIVDVNEEMREKIVANGTTVFEGVEGHRGEHALEVHLPFLQFVLKEFKLVPIVMGDQSKEYVYDLANALTQSVDENTLIVASSDLSHFYPKPRAWELDSRLMDFVEHYDYEGLLKALELHVVEACGGGPITAMMKTMGNLGVPNVKVLHHSDSGDVSGDNMEVVGYMSAIFYD